jgi:hypothetical protein
MWFDQPMWPQLHTYSRETSLERLPFAEYLFLWYGRSRPVRLTTCPCLLSPT